MKFIIYSDGNYEYQVKNFLDSVDYAKVKNNVIYFTVGFESSLNHPQLIKQRIEYDLNIPSLALYAPKICLEALKLFDDEFCYVDTDVILSRRFNDFELDFSDDFPMFCRSPIDYPFIFSIDESGEMIQNELAIMNYFGIEKRSMDYVLSCFFSFDKKSKDFLEEWMSMCENKYLLKDIKKYMPFLDETPLNALFWKRKIEKNYGYKFINTHKFSTFSLCEGNERIITTRIDENIYEYCHDSNFIYFYHGYKGKNAAKEFKLLEPKMKITQVTPGVIKVPPNGWGAVEKIIWEYTSCLESLGNEVQIRYLNDVEPSDIVHIHTANLALEAYERGIPYVFSLHDHHVVYFGKDSSAYKQNLEAIKKSIISFTHAEFLVDFFDETDKLFFLTHGVNTSFFSPKKNNFEGEIQHKLLCLGNNGYLGNPAEDRKGFRQAIEAAIELNLPITVAGPENNKNFFNENPDLASYEKLTVIATNPTEEEIVEIYRNHTIFLHPSKLEAGHPNLTLLEALSCGLPVVGTYSGSEVLKGLIRISPNKTSVINGIKEAIGKYEYYVEQTQQTREKFNWTVVCERLNKIYESIILINKKYTSETTKSLYINAFEKTEINHKNEISDSIHIEFNFFQNPKVEITGFSEKNFVVEFWDDKNILHHRDTIRTNMWVSVNKHYDVKWNIKIYCEKELIYDQVLNYDGKIYIALDSKAIGDTIAWFPQVEEFRKKHNCKVICSTFHNDLLRKNYPEIEFIEPGTVAYNIQKMFTIGWFYLSNGNMDYSKHPVNFRNQNLQKTASDILGLELKETRPKLDYDTNERPIQGKYFCIGIHATCQAKYWNNPEGWQQVVDFLKLNGFEVVLLSKEENYFMGNKNPDGVIKLENKSIKEICSYLHHSEGFIGLGSGLSWLSWAVGKPTILISGFSRPESEMSDCIRIFTPNPEKTCNGCFNDHRLDAGDWNWCPSHKNTERQFECTKSITAEMVIEKVKNLFQNQ